MEIRAFPGDAVIVCTGGRHHLRQVDQQRHQHRHGAAALYQQGACYANGEFIQVHPTAIPGADKLRLISESARGEGGRVWVPKDRRRSAPRKTSPRRTATTSSRRSTRATATSSRATSPPRALQVFHERGMGVDGKTEVYLDVTHIDRAMLERSSPASSRSTRSSSATTRAKPDEGLPRRALLDGRPLGRLQPGDQHPRPLRRGRGRLPVHGANRLGANSLLSCIYGGIVAGPQAMAYAKSLPAQAGDGGHAAESQRQKEKNAALL